MSESEITSLIPHRPPFLWVDRIVETTEDSITTEKDIPADLDVFSGHYPGYPLMPGVLLCECIFQTGALFLAQLLKTSKDTYDGVIPVLTKISSARFKRQVLPGETVRMRVKLQETISSVCIFKGIAEVNGKVAVKTEFSCALTSGSSSPY